MRRRSMMTAWRKYLLLRTFSSYKSACKYLRFHPFPTIFTFSKTPGLRELSLLAVVVQSAH